MAKSTQASKKYTIRRIVRVTTENSVLSFSSLKKRGLVPTEHGDPWRRWTVSIAILDENGLVLYDEGFIESVDFKLHETFDNPIRTVSQPPFAITEVGWGGFGMDITVHVKGHPDFSETIEHDFNFDKEKYERNYLIKFKVTPGSEVESMLSKTQKILRGGKYVKRTVDFQPDDDAAPHASPSSSDGSVDEGQTRMKKPRTHSRSSSSDDDSSDRHRHKRSRDGSGDSISADRRSSKSRNLTDSKQTRKDPSEAKHRPSVSGKDSASSSRKENASGLTPVGVARAPAALPADGDMSKRSEASEMRSKDKPKPAGSEAPNADLTRTKAKLGDPFRQKERPDDASDKGRGAEPESAKSRHSEKSKKPKIDGKDDSLDGSHRDKTKESTQSKALAGSAQKRREEPARGREGGAAQSLKNKQSDSNRRSSIRSERPAKSDSDRTAAKRKSVAANSASEFPGSDAPASEPPRRPSDRDGSHSQKRPKHGYSFSRSRSRSRSPFASSIESSPNQQQQRPKSAQKSVTRSEATHDTHTSSQRSKGYPAGGRDSSVSSVGSASRQHKGKSKGHKSYDAQSRRTGDLSSASDSDASPRQRRSRARSWSRSLSRGQSQSRSRSRDRSMSVDRGRHRSRRRSSSFSPSRSYSHSHSRSRGRRRQRSGSHDRRSGRSDSWSRSASRSPSRDRGHKNDRTRTKSRAEKGSSQRHRYGSGSDSGDDAQMWDRDNRKHKDRRERERHPVEDGGGTDARSSRREPVGAKGRDGESRDKGRPKREWNEARSREVDKRKDGKRGPESSDKRSQNVHGDEHSTYGDEATDDPKAAKSRQRSRVADESSSKADSKSAARKGRVQKLLGTSAGTTSSGPGTPEVKSKRERDGLGEAEVIGHGDLVDENGAPFTVVQLAEKIVQLDDTSSKQILKSLMERRSADAPSHLEAGFQVDLYSLEPSHLAAMWKFANRQLSPTKSSA